MKKLFYLLFLLPLSLMVSCNSDDDLPDVNIQVKFSNVVYTNNRVYVVQGDTLKVDGVYIQGNGGKTAVISSISYIWNNFRVAWSPLAPFNMDFVTDYTQPKNYLLTLNMDIAQVDKTLSYAVIDYPVTVVADAADLPDGQTPGDYTSNITISPHSK